MKYQVLNGLKQPIAEFLHETDRDAFLEMMQEEYPDAEFKALNR